MIKSVQGVSWIGIWAVLHIALLSMFGFAYTEGWIWTIIINDISYIVLGLTIVFIGVILASGVSFFNFSRYYNNVTVYQKHVNCLSPSLKSEYKEWLRAQLSRNAAYLKFFSSTMVIVGLIGTVLGLIVGMSGVSIGDASTLDGAKNILDGLYSGLQVAFYTTLTGALYGLWLTMLHFILAIGSSDLYRKVVSPLWKL